MRREWFEFQPCKAKLAAQSLCRVVLMDVLLARSELISLQWLLIACCWCPLLPLFTASCGISYNNSTTHAGEDATTPCIKCTGRFLPQVCHRMCHTYGLANLASRCFVYHISLASVFWRWLHVDPFSKDKSSQWQDQLSRHPTCSQSTALLCDVSQPVT